MWSIIGGSGFEKFDGFEIIDRLNTQTPFGPTSSGLCRAKINNTEFLFLSRHGLDHELLPSHINFKANIYALKKFGAKAILSISAVGSLREDLAPGDLVVPGQYIDRTKRTPTVNTYFGDKTLGSLVGHLSMGEPIDKRIFTLIKDMLSKLNYKKFHLEKTYLCMEGPNFSTRSESKMYRLWGADIIGMTNFPEYALAKEANLLYVPLCYVTDYDSWRHEEEPVSLEQVIAVMKSNNTKAFSLISHFLNNVAFQDLFVNYKSGLPMGIMSSLENLSSEQKNILETLY